jgi:hypothetical protein
MIQERRGAIHFKVLNTKKCEGNKQSTERENNQYIPIWHRHGYYHWRKQGCQRSPFSFELPVFILLVCHSSFAVLYDLCLSYVQAFKVA